MVKGNEKKAIGIALLVVLPMLPAAFLHLLNLDAAIGTWMLGGIAATITAFVLNPRLAIGVTLVLAALCGVGYVGAQHAWLAALCMAIGAGLYGLSSRRGLQSYITMAPIALGFVVAEGIAPAPNADVAVNALITAGVILIAGSWGTLIGGILGRKVPTPPLHPISNDRAVWFAALMAVSLGGAMWLVSHFQWQHGGAWMLLTMIIVIQPYVQDTWRKGMQRVAGTIVGFVVVMVIGEVISVEWALGLLAIAFLAAAIYVLLFAHKSYWIYTTLLTPGIVIAESLGSSIESLAFARLGFTIAGAAVAFVLVLIIGPHERKRARAAGEHHY